MEITRLYNIAEDEGISVSFLALPETKGISLELNGDYHIALDSDSSKSPSEEKVILAHELGHCVSGGLYGISEDSLIRIRLEKKAARWAIERLVPLSELKNAIKCGDEALSCLAERFGVTEEFMQKAIKHYTMEFSA